jgi:predicted transcriptional regulator
VKLPCEIASNSVVPAIRALLARELLETYEMKQTEVAGLLGITQTAVSKYTHRVRGIGLQIDRDGDVRVVVLRIAAALAKNGLDRTDLALRICSACELIRRKRLMCKLCERADPSINVQQCFVCSRKASGQSE